MLDDHKVETTATIRLAPGSYAEDDGSTKCTECEAGRYNDEPGAEQEMGVPMKNLCNQLGVQRFLKLMPWIIFNIVSMSQKTVSLRKSRPFGNQISECFQNPNAAPA